MKGFLAVLDCESGTLTLYDCAEIKEGTDLGEFVDDKFPDCEWMYLRDGLRDIRIER